MLFENLSFIPRWKFT